MGKPTGFLEIERRDRGYDKPAERLKTWREFTHPLPDGELARQAARCMGCGIPFCHQGCPVNNQIPDWNDLVYRDQWRAALENLHSTNNFPEFTGRVCPAPCEASCTLNIDDNPVTIKTIECQIVDRGWAEGWIEPQVTAQRHRPARGGGGLGPRRPRLRPAAGPRRPPASCCSRRATASAACCATASPTSRWRSTSSTAAWRRWRPRASPSGPASRSARTSSVEELLGGYDAVVLSGGAEDPRDLPVPGRELAGVHFAMDFLTQQNKRVRRRRRGGRGAPAATITAKGKHVIVIGGGDTGSDCIGTSNRQGAASVTQLEIMPMPPERENKALAWPDWPLKLRTSSSQEEGVRPRLRRDHRAHGRQGPRRRRSTAPASSGRRAPTAASQMSIVPGSEFALPADLVLLAMGFVGPRRAGAHRAGRRRARRARQRQGQHRRLPLHRPAASSPAATCAAASRWWSGRSARAASAPARSTSS